MPWDKRKNESTRSSCWVSMFQGTFKQENRNQRKSWKKNKLEKQKGVKVVSCNISSACDKETCTSVSGKEKFYLVQADK